MAPVDLLLLCGIFGNISDDDVHATVHTVPSLLRTGGTVIWTRGHLDRPVDLRPVIRGWFAEVGLTEVAFDGDPEPFGVGVARLGSSRGRSAPGTRTALRVRSVGCLEHRVRLGLVGVHARQVRVNVDHRPDVCGRYSVGGDGVARSAACRRCCLRWSWSGCRRRGVGSRRRPRCGWATPTLAARLRLDATARLLQDIANDDARDAALDNANGWVVRRTLIDVRTPAVMDEQLTLTTFCGGLGRSWAERRTSIVGDQGAAIEAVSLWVQIDIEHGRPAPLGPAFHERYGEAPVAASCRAVSRSPPRRPRPHPSPWPIRAADLDVFGHVNNAVAWTVLEERLVDADGRAGIGEVEYPARSIASPAQLVTATIPAGPGRSPRGCTGRRRYPGGRPLASGSVNPAPIDAIYGAIYHTKYN